MNQTVKKDLFAPTVPKKRRLGAMKKTSLIPNKLGWNKENGSWAVKMGIIKTEQNQ